MMPIWVFMVRYDGEMACSTHLTEKGAILTAIEDVLQYLGVEDEEDAKNIFSEPRRYSNVSAVEAALKEDEVQPPEWDIGKMQKMNREQLYRVYAGWCEKTWDHHIYECEIMKTTVTG
tara:strand:+ start:294 stop:647 length:354 start_codon:yes stop_codon:yes gene_type:complete